MSIEDHQIPPFSCVPATAKSVVDLGCNDGTTTEFYAERFPDARVLGVELDLKICDIAAQRVQRFGPRVYILNQAVGWPEGETTAYIDDCSAVSTLTPYQHRQVTETTVNVLSLDSVLVIEEFDEVDFLKIDIEGAELMLFESTEWMQKTKCFLVECHADEAIRKFYSIDRFNVKPLLSDPNWGNHLIGVAID